MRNILILLLAHKNDYICYLYYLVWWYIFSDLIRVDMVYHYVLAEHSLFTIILYVCNLYMCVWIIPKQANVCMHFCWIHIRTINKYVPQLSCKILHKLINTTLIFSKHALMCSLQYVLFFCVGKECRSQCI